jgi:hypothetical protein
VPIGWWVRVETVPPARTAGGSTSLVLLGLDMVTGADLRHGLHPDALRKARLDAIRGVALQRRIATYALGRAVWLVRTTPAGYPLAVRRIRVPGLASSHALDLVDAGVTAMLEKKETRKVIGGPAVRISDVKFAGAYPTLYDYLTQVQWPDNTPRQTGSVLIFVDGGMVKGMLRDREMGVCCWVASDTLSNLFAVLEAAVRDPKTDWRVDRQLEGQQAKRTKKGS